MEFVEHLKKYLKEDEISDLLISLQNEKSKHALILNTEKMKEEDFEKEFPLIQKHPFIPKCYIYEEDIYFFGKNIYFDMGVYYLFEPCSPLVSYLLNPNKDDLILDACAAPGGKTIHTSLMMNNDGLIISNELSKERAHILSSNVERMGRKNVVVISNQIKELAKKYKNTFSKIILDAPCSGSGMFRKESKMQEDWTYNKVLSLASLQKELIDYCFSMLQEGGVMVYSTCSFSYEEDEETILSLLEKNENAYLIDIEDNEYFYKSEKKIGIHLFPHKYFGEGHYICLIGKRISSNPISIKKKKEDKFPQYKEQLNLDGFTFKYDNNIFLLPYDFDLKNLYIIRGGLKLGTIEKHGFDYDHALSHYLSEFENEINLDLENAKKFLAGEQLFKENKNGFCLVKYNNIPLGWGKTTSNRINNRYPKGLRKRF